MKEVNKSIPKVDGMGLVLGRPAYTEDITDKNALVIKILRSPYAFARIKDIDTSQAEKMSGVHAVFTYKNVPRKIVTRAGQGYPEPSPKDKFILDEYVRYIGDEVAFVAAETEEIAKEALKAIKVDYEVLEPVLDLEEAIGHKSIIHPEKEAYTMFPMGFDPQKNIACTYNMEIGDTQKVLEESEVVVKNTYYTQAQAHVAMETHASSAYIDIQGRLVIITSTQVPFHVRRIVAEALEIPISKIRVIKPRIGGGFGGKQGIHGEFFVALATLKTGKPTVCIYNRKEVFEASYARHAMKIDIAIGSDKEGNLTALDMHILSDTGAYGEHALTVFMVAGSKTLPLYNKVKAVKFGGEVVYTNHVSAGAYRGYGAIQGNFALEAAMDELAKKLNMDPVELRLKNTIKEGETSEIFKIMGEGGEGVEMIVESCKLDYCIKRGKELIEWDKKSKGIKINDHTYRGVGMAIAMQGSGIPEIDMASAVIKLNDDGFFNLLVGATDLGTGSDTILAQIAAEALGVSTDKIIPYSSDTDLTPFDTGAYASSTTFVSGNAVKKAALNMKNLILETAAQKFDLNQEDLDFNGEDIIDKEGKKIISLKELATGFTYNFGHIQKQLVATDSYCGIKSPPPYMAGFAEVEVDTLTGKVKLLDYVAVVDCGTTINPNLAKIQVEGGLVQGIGMALFEDVKYTKAGKMLTNTLMNYKIPSRMDIPDMKIEFAESYEPAGPYGAKSVGEIGIDSPPAAIANAIYNAVGIRLTKLPFTPDKVLKALLERKQNG
jgi:CO/xanthine dehydrogenase Mo-binding subunit